MLLLIDCRIDNLLFIFQYAHKDDNNKFLIKKWNEDPPLPFTKVRNISNGMNYENEINSIAKHYNFQFFINLLIGLG